MTTRRLAAIVVLDVVGYSRMMAEDEAGTHAAMKAHRNELDPIFLNRGGRIVKGTGDGALVEIPSAVEAVEAAVEAQRLMAERNAALPTGRRMLLRIGVNLGDVIVEDDGDIYGDGVNVAARLEGLADPGGVCVSAAIHDQVVGRVDHGLEDLGEVEVKNIPRPVRAYRVRIPATARSAPVSDPTGVPALAVAPFREVGGAGDSFLADGITDDLITALSNDRALRVLARSSSYAVFSGDAALRDAAREVDATYVVEGSVRRSGDRVRVTASLVDAESGTQLWADRVDGSVEDIFELQDEIVGEIVARINPSVEVREVERRAALSADELDARGLVLRARRIALRNTAEATREAIALLERANERDPDSALVLANLAAAWTQAAFNRWPVDDRNPFGEIYRTAARATELDPDEPLALPMLAVAENYLGNLGTARELANRALQVAPHDALALNAAGQVAIFGGDHDAAIGHLTEAWTLARHEPWRFHIASNLAFANYLAGRYEAAISWADRGLEAGEYLQLRAIAAAAAGKLGRSSDAGHHLRRVSEARPGASVGSFLRNIRWSRPEDVAHYREGLVEAGLAE